MGAAIGTIPYFSTYQPGALPIASTVYIEIVDSLSATSAQSWNQSQIDFVGKAPAIIPNANPVANDRFAFYQAATGLPKACTLGNFGVPFGNVPTGGTAGQMLVKLSATNFDAGWSSIIQGPFGVVGTATVTGTLAITGTLALNGSTTALLRNELTADRTYYVRAAGSDSNNGLTALTAFATVQHMLNIGGALDAGGFAVTFDIGAGIWDNSANVEGFVIPPIPNNRTINVRGAGKTLTFISLEAHGVGIAGFAIYDLTIDSGLGGNFAGLVSGEHCEVVIQTGVRFKTTSVSFCSHMFAYDSAAITFAGADLEFDGNFNYACDGTAFGRYGNLQPLTITMTGSPAFDAFASLNDVMLLTLDDVTVSGACTGLQYLLSSQNASIRGRNLTIPGSGQNYNFLGATVVSRYSIPQAAPRSISAATGTVDAGDSGIISTGSATLTLTLFPATRCTGRQLYVKTTVAFTVVSDSSNVVPIEGGAAGTAMIPAVAGAWGIFQSDGTNWITVSKGYGNNIVGTTIITGTFGVIGTATFTGTHGIVGTTLVTGIVGIIGTATLTGSLIVNSSTATIVGVDAGTTGPVLAIYHSSPSPAALDQIGRVRFFGNNSAAAQMEYAEIGAQILSTTAGAEYGCLKGSVMSNGTMSDTLLSTETFLLGYQNAASSNFEYVFRGPSTKTTFMYLESFSPGARGPSYNIWHNSASQAAADVPGSFAVDGNAANGTTYIHYSTIDTVITNASTTGAGANMIFYTIGSAVMATTMTLDDRNNVVIGTAAIASAATNGFLYLETTNGTPTGTPTSYSGRSPMVFDTGNNKLWFYNGGWKAAVFA